MPDSSSSERSVLPIPDRPTTGLITYDAKDPDTTFPPIEPLRPPAGAPNVLIVLLDDVRLRRVERLRRPVPHADRRAAGRRRPASTPASTRRRCARRPAQALLTGRNHHSVGMGGITEIATSAPGYSSIRPEHRGAAGRDAEAERLLDRAVRQVPRGAGLGDEPDGAVRRLAHRRRRLRALLRLHRRRDQPVRARRSTRAPTPVEPRPDAGGGLPLHRGHDRPRDRLGAPAEGADAGQAVLRLLRARRARTRRTTCPTEWSDKYKGKFDAGLGRAARGDVRAPEGARRDPRRRRADRAARRRSRPGTTCPTS